MAFNLTNFVLLALFLALPALLAAAGRDCGQIVPGITWMSRGVDITSLDLFPSDLRSTNGYRHALFDFTCDRNHTWTHPTIPNYSYALPDQIAAINTMPAGALNIKTSFHQDLKEYKESLAATVGIDVNFGFWGSFSASVGYKEARENLMKTNKSIAETSAYVSAVQIDFQDPEEMSLNHNFLNYITHKLPAKYEDDHEMYNKFIETFGTHYFDTAKFGGYLYQKTIIENSYLYKSDEKQLHASVKARFMSFVTANVEVNKESKSVDEEFNQNSETHFYYYGGLTDLSNQKNNSHLTKWWDTVSKDPWLFGGQLVPIENLIRNQTIKAQVKKAVSVKRALEFLKDFKDTIYLGNIKLPAEELQKLSTIEHYLYNPKSGLAELDKMDKNLDDLFLRVQEIRDRALINEYKQRLDHLWDIHYFGCNYYLADMYCSNSQNTEYMEAQYNLFNVMRSKLDRFIKPTEKLDDAEVQQLISDVAKFVRRHEANVGWCASGDTACQTCAKQRVNCERVTVQNVKDYGEKLWNSYYHGPLGCKYNLVYNCKICSIKNEIVEQYNHYNALYYKFTNLYQQIGKLDNRATIQDTMLESYNFMYYHNHTEVDLWRGDAKCQVCIEHNVDCFNSNSNYIKSGQFCNFVDSWKAIKYRPRTIGSSCTLMSLP